MKALLDDLNRVIRPQKGPAIRPRDAATLILIQGEGTGIRVLMGRRHERHAFMPGKYVFPGGGVEPADSRVKPLTDLHPDTRAKLMAQLKGRGRASPARARALAMASLRETFEETGIALGRPCPRAHRTRSPSWAAYFATGVAPALDKLVFAARAITPPGRPRRFDARFFITDANHLTIDRSALPGGDGELDDLKWLSVDEACDTDIPPITRVVLHEIQSRLSHSDGWSPARPVPFFTYHTDHFRRREL